MLDEYEKYHVLKTIDKLFDNKEAGDIVEQEEINKETGYKISKVVKILEFFSNNNYIVAEFALGDNKILSGFVKSITTSGYQFLSELEITINDKLKNMTKVDHVKDLLQRLDKIPAFASSELSVFRSYTKMILMYFYPDKDYLEKEEDINFFPSKLFSNPINPFINPSKQLSQKCLDSWSNGKKKYKSLLERIIKEQEVVDEKSQIEKITTKKSNEIFIVHGQDRNIKIEIDSLLRKIGLVPVFLYEQPNRNKTIIEKFIEHSDVQFAIILFTPDDKGCKVKQRNPQLMKRPRQNVIFEMGYFIGKLSRENVCVVYKETKDFELLSDLSGCLYIKFDKTGKWKQSIVKELQTAGYAVTTDDI
jgi:predicted nucleotide-binding protein